MHTFLEHLLRARPCRAPTPGISPRGDTAVCAGRADGVRLQQELPEGNHELQGESGGGKKLAGRRCGLQLGFPG